MLRERERCTTTNLLVVEEGGIRKGDQGEGNVVLLSIESEKENQEMKGYLDSGANANVYKSKDMFVELGEKSNSTLKTACGGGEKGSEVYTGKVKGMVFSDGETEMGVERGVFCESLVENLISVGKLCDSNSTVVFDKYCYAVYKGEVSATGDKVHEQRRDSRTGLYPINLVIRENNNTRVSFVSVQQLQEQYKREVCCSGIKERE